MSVITGRLNYYRSLERNWELQKGGVGKLLQVPALFMIGERDIVFGIAGMDQILAAMPNLVSTVIGFYALKGPGFGFSKSDPAPEILSCDNRLSGLEVPKIIGEVAECHRGIRNQHYDRSEDRSSPSNAGLAGFTQNSTGRGRFGVSRHRPASLGCAASSWVPATECASAGRTGVKLV